MKFLYLLTITAFINVQASDNFQATQAKAVMGNVYDSFVKIIPYIYSDKAAHESLKLQKTKMS